MSQREPQQSGLQRLFAGSVSGGLESFITYPTEFVKTRQQLPSTLPSSKSPINIFLSTLRQPGGISLIYGGSAAFCASNASKSAVRFFTFDALRDSLSKKYQCPPNTPYVNLLAGLGAGIAESVLVVTPGETLKTKIIDNQRQEASKRYRNVSDAIQKILRKEGPQGLYRGVVPVSLKQGSNAMVRFTTYSYFLSVFRSTLPSNSQSLAPSAAGGLAGIVTVYCTMPMENIKTRLQAIGNTKQGTWSCFKQMVVNEGVRSLWKGTTPRMVRLTVSGVISFSVYEKVIEVTSRMNGFSSREAQGSVA